MNFAMGVAKMTNLMIDVPVYMTITHDVEVKEDAADYDISLRMQW